jgi:hypothetical protein
MVHVQPFKKGEKMNYHTDTRPNKKRKLDKQVLATQMFAPTLSLNLFDDFLFWSIPIVEGTVVDARQSLDYRSQRCIRLSDGMSMCWPMSDDHAFKHGVWPCPSMRDAAVRVSVVYRWSNPALVESFELEYPYRIVQS